MIPRPEHPRPQFMRESWMNLNGAWKFEIDNGRSGLARGLAAASAELSGEITVPFCPESRLSGVAHTDFMYGVWYQRTVTLTEQEISGRVFLHFGAVDHECTIYVNGDKAGYHKGGYVSFRVDITSFVHTGENVITVNALDDTRDPMIPRGKQSEEYFSHGCDYTRTTGIWQTVWLEFVPAAYIDRVHYTPDAQKGILTLMADLCGSGTLRTEVFYEGKPMGSAETAAHGGQILQTIQLDEIHLWEPGAGRLYDVVLTYGEDKLCSYFGLRSIRMDDARFYLNEKSVFQRLILDQGFYPDGIYTAPSDAELRADIERSMTMGFNGARLHEKIFEERFLYHCDKLGYLVWGEYPNWGLDHTRPEAVYSILPEWIEELDRDRDHPAIIGWCPFNETWDMHGCKQHDPLLSMVYRVTKAIDPSRPCIDTSGNFHVETDIFDVHDYNQDPVTFKEHYDTLMTDGELYDQLTDNGPKSSRANRQFYTGGATFVSEFGGIRWAAGQNDASRKNSWGYGKDVLDADDFRARFKGLFDALLDNDRMFGLCYTQLTDVEQEQNGLYTYDRTPKFDPEWVKSVVARKAAVED